MCSKNSASSHFAYSMQRRHGGDKGEIRSAGVDLSPSREMLLTHGSHSVGMRLLSSPDTFASQSPRLTVTLRRPSDGGADKCNTHCTVRVIAHMVIEQGRDYISQSWRLGMGLPRGPSEQKCTHEPRRMIGNSTNYLCMTRRVHRISEVAWWQSRNLPERAFDDSVGPAHVPWRRRRRADVPECSMIGTFLSRCGTL
jgi:hypothetical protein